MTAEDIEQQIRRHPTANERFLLGLLDEARAQVEQARSDGYDEGRNDVLASLEMES